MKRRDTRSVKRTFVFAPLVLLTLLASGTGIAYSDDKASEKLESEYDRESNPKKRTRIAMDLADERLKQLRSAYDSEDPAKEQMQLEKYLSAIERVEQAVSQPGGGASKETEIHLRHQTAVLENIKMSTSYAERGSLEKAVARVAKLHEQVLYSIMKK